MAYFKLSFKTTPDGRLVYFPWSNFGPGYEVPSEARLAAIRRYNKISTMIGVPLVLATAAAWKLDANLVWRLLGIGLVAAHLCHFIWQVQRWSQDMPQSELRLRYREALEHMLAARGPALLWFGLILCLLMSAAGAFVLIAFSDSVGFGLFVLGIFGPGAALFAWGLRLQRRVKRQPHAGQSVTIE